jgi:hypothetical protein
MPDSPPHELIKLLFGPQANAMASLVSDRLAC